MNFIYIFPELTMIIKFCSYATCNSFIILISYHQLEKPLLNKAKQKMSQLVDSHIHQSASTSSASHNMNTAKRLTAARFIEEAITVLIKARHTLQFGYVYGYYLQDTSIKRMVFELLQVCLFFCG